ncbi:hypothetical protein [Lacticaseibacillus pantheris]|uniref:hypothetical protein n=1 Tax=Lacticaseibacillus pantheris TaxID=171523 RepID=UPI0006D0F2C3|nr:hypothetical protein [Lacticaseibacillus pantheris]
MNKTRLTYDEVHRQVQRLADNDLYLFVKALAEYCDEAEITPERYDLWFRSDSSLLDESLEHDLKW